jgi:hypothetical protein
MSTPSGSPSSPQPARHPLTRGNVLLGFARRVRHADGTVRVRPVWARLAVAVLSVGLGGWLVLATAAWGFVRFGRGVEAVNFFDIALPFRWSEYQRKRGDSYIEQAKVALRESKVRESFQMLRVGVAKSPRNLEGRRLLAQIFAGPVGRPDLGIKVLEGGIEYAADDLDYLKTHIQLLFANQEDLRVMKMTAEQLALFPATTEKARILALAGATACYFRGNYDQAEDYLERYELQRNKDGRLLQAQIDWDRGLREVAVVRLRSFLQDSPGEEAVYHVLAGYLRETGRKSEADTLCIQRSNGFPKSLGARASLLTVYHDRGDQARLDREIDGLLRDFPDDQRVVLQCAEFAMSTKNVALAERLRDVCTTRGMPPELGVLIVLQARVAARDYRATLAEIEKAAAEKPEWLERLGGTLAGLQAVASYGLGSADMGDLYLAQFLNQRNIRAENLIAIASRLQEAGAVEAARRVLAQSVLADELNQAALTALVDLDLRLGNLEKLPRNLERLLTMRKPSLDVLSRAYEALGSDFLLFSSERERVLPALREALEARGRSAGRADTAGAR